MSKSDIDRVFDALRRLPYGKVNKKINSTLAQKQVLTDLTKKKYSLVDEIIRDMEKHLFLFPYRQDQYRDAFVSEMQEYVNENNLGDIILPILKEHYWTIEGWFEEIYDRMVGKENNRLRQRRLTLIFRSFLLPTLLGSLGSVFFFGLPAAVLMLLSGTFLFLLIMITNV